MLSVPSSPGLPTPLRQKCFSFTHSLAFTHTFKILVPLLLVFFRPLAACQRRKVIPRIIVRVCWLMFHFFLAENLYCRLMFLFSYLFLPLLWGKIWCFSYAVFHCLSGLEIANLKCSRSESNWKHSGVFACVYRAFSLPFCRFCVRTAVKRRIFLIPFLDSGLHEQ